MSTGTVKWFNGQKGFGFIQPNDGGNDVFVHVSAVERAGLPGLAESEGQLRTQDRQDAGQNERRKSVACLSRRGHFTDVLKWPCARSIRGLSGFARLRVWIRKDGKQEIG